MNKNDHRFITRCVISIVIMIMLSASGCDRDNPNTVAQKFCDCMKKNGSPKQYRYAYTICKGQLVQQSRLYLLSIEAVDNADPREHISPKTNDSVTAFMRSFDEYTIEHCCNVTQMCPGGDSVTNK